MTTAIAEHAKRLNLTVKTFTDGRTGEPVYQVFDPEGEPIHTRYVREDVALDVIRWYEGVLTASERAKHRRES